MSEFSSETEVTYEDIQMPSVDVTEYENKIAELTGKVKELEEQLTTRELCKRCGRELGTEPIKVSDDALEEYFKCMLGQKPFEKTFRLFGGKLLLTFRELSGASIVESNKRAEAAKSADEFADTLEMYLITGMLTKVELYDDTTMITSTIYEMTDEQLVANTKNPKQAYDKLVETVGQMHIAVIRKACTVFEYLITALIEKSQDENFYVDAGLL